MYIYEIYLNKGLQSKKDDPTTPCQYDILSFTAALRCIPSFLTQPGGMSHSIKHGNLHLTMWWPQNICQVLTQFRAASSSCLAGHLVTVTTTLVWQIVLEYFSTLSGGRISDISILLCCHLIFVVVVVGYGYTKLFPVIPFLRHQLERDGEYCESLTELKVMANPCCTGQMWKRAARAENTAILQSSAPQNFWQHWLICPVI